MDHSKIAFLIGKLKARSADVQRAIRALERLEISRGEAPGKRPGESKGQGRHAASNVRGLEP